MELAQLELGNDNGNRIFGYVFDWFYLVMDILGNTKLPMTNISFAYWIIFGIIVELSIFAINGTLTQYNALSGDVVTAGSQLYSSAAKYQKRTISNFQRKEGFRRVKNAKFDRKNAIITNKNGKFVGQRENFKKKRGEKVG